MPYNLESIYAVSPISYLDTESTSGTGTIVYPYAYKIVYRPYHDTIRLYKIPVYNTTDPNKFGLEVSYEDRDRFNLSLYPELIGPDDWADPSENILNDLMFGGAGLTRALTTGAVKTTLNTIAEQMPYTTARGLLASRLATNSKIPAWLTPKSAAVIDATVLGGTTAGFLNDMRENGPTVSNVTGAALGFTGLGVEAAPTIKEGILAGKRLYNTYRLSRQLNRAARQFDGTVGANYFRSPSNWSKTDKLEFVPSYVHESDIQDLVRPGKLKDDFYNHTFNVDAGDVKNYSEISDYIAPIENDVNTLNRDLFLDILKKNVDEGLLFEDEALLYYNTLSLAKNNIANYSSLPKEYWDAIIRSFDPNILDRYYIGNDGRIWGTFKVGDRWKGLNSNLLNGSSILYITDARNSPATIAIHEGGHGILRSIISQTSGIDLKNFAKNDVDKINFIESLGDGELAFFKSQPPSVLELLYTNRDLLNNIPIMEATNVARDIRAMLTTRGIKNKELLYKYINEISDDLLYNIYPLTKYLQVMRKNAKSKKDYINFLKKLIIGTAFSAPIISIEKQNEED